MRVICGEHPPNFDLIDATFHVSGKPIIFCYGDAIYNPQSINVGLELLRHEAIHSQQQGQRPVAWWKLYCEDDGFRLNQELPAHVAEYHAGVEQAAKLLRKAPTRQVRRQVLRSTAVRLAAGLYGYQLTKDRARLMLKDMING